MSDESNAGRTLQERQAVLADWQDRERRRQGLQDAQCCRCVFHVKGRCHHTSNLVRGHVSLANMTVPTSEPSERAAHDWCEHFLPHGDFDPRPTF